MSHFTVLVPAADEQELDQRLLPFYQYGCSGHYDDLVQPYLKFCSVEEEKRHEWENASAKRVVLPETGELLSPYDERFRVQTGEILGGLLTRYSYQVPENYLRRSVPLRDLCTFEDYMTDSGYEKTDQGYGYWHNPNAKWDWYQVGGRWDGLFKLRAGGNSNEALVSEIDFEGMREAARIDRVLRWDAVEVALKSFDPNLTVEAFLAQTDDEKRAVIDGLREKADVPGEAVYRVMFFEPDGATNREEYVGRAGKESLVYAFIDLGGQWHATGDMLMFGITADKQPDYDDAFWSFIESLPADQKLYVVDCHI